MFSIPQIQFSRAKISLCPHHTTEYLNIFCQFFGFKKKSCISKVYNLRYLSSNMRCISPTHLPSPTNMESEFN